MRKDLLAVAIIILFIVVLFSGTKIQSVDDFYSDHMDTIAPESKTATLSINCAAVLDRWQDLDPQLQSEEFVPADGVILPPSQYVLREGDTVFDLLKRAVSQHKIHMEYQGADSNAFSSVYIQGINYLYEFSCGPLSGWMYKVNGEVPQYGADKVVLKDGDVVEWIYTCDLGRDVGVTQLEEGCQR